MTASSNTSANARARMLKLQPDGSVADALVANNFHSALQIAGMAPSHFVRQMAPKLGGNTDTARQIHNRATQVRSSLLHLWANVHTAVQSRQFNTLSVANVGPDVAAQFEQMPSYAELFGTLNYCECDECRSIFGAAAYLVDLLRIIDTYVTQPNAGTIPAWLSFATRRGDLAAIPLTCDKTNDTFPQLRIVNERLTAQATALLSVPAGHDLFETVAVQTYPFNLPFHLPLARIEVDLAQINVAPADIAATFGTDKDSLARARLGLSFEAYNFLTTSLAGDAANLAVSYGVAQSALSGLSNVDALLAATGLSLTDLQVLLRQNLSDAEITAGVPLDFFINKGGKALAYVLGDAKSGTAPTVANLNNGALDRVSRFVRLAQRLNLDFATLDWALAIANGGAPDITTAALQALADMLDLARLAGLDVATLCTLLGPIKTYGAGTGSVSTAPFDVIFNDPRVLGSAAPYHPAPNPLNSGYTDAALSWNIGGTAPADLALAARLSGALRVPLATLNRLGGMLFGAGPASLTIANLSALYRHAVLLRLTGLPADQHFQFLKLADWQMQSFTAAQLRELLCQSAWLSGSGLTVYQIDYFLNGNTSPFVDPLYTANGFEQWFTAMGQATANLPTPDQQYAKLEGLLAAFFGIPVDLLDAVMPLVGAAAPPPASTWQDAFLAAAHVAKPLPPSPYVMGAVGGLSRWLVLVQALKLPLPLLNAIASSKNAAAFGFADPTLKTLAFGDVAMLSTFMQQTAAFDDVSFGLVDFVVESASGVPANAQAGALAQVTQWDKDQIGALLPQQTAQNRTQAVAALQRQFALMGKLGADPDFITGYLEVTTASTSAWSDNTGLADSVLLKVKGVIPDAQWDAIASQIDGAVAERMRGALTPLVLAKIRANHPEIDSLRRLSEYMLIDVEISGVLQNSYIREALNAAQFYLQRCRLRLETGVLELDIPEVWWEWMMNYRVWEANREIFLYPENYIDPTLRQSKTKLFSDLESRLQQDAITHQTVDAAYQDYLDGLCKLAQLVYVDAYHGTVHDPERGDIDTRFMFARTATDPYTYYYISFDTSVWSEWKQIEITIPSALVTPVYAFNHLFLFWVELKQSKPSPVGSANTVNGINGIAYSASIKYSFTKFDGTWIQPQVLITDKVVYFAPSESQQTASLGPFQSQPQLFQMTDLYWNKVAVNVILGQPGKPDKLCVMYGPFLDRGLTANTLPPPPVPAPVINNTSSELSFQQTVFDISTTFNQFVGAQVLGQLPMMNTEMLDRDLNPSYVARPNEVIVLQNDAAENAPPLFKPEIDLSAGTLRLVPAGSAYQSNYLTDYTPPYSNARITRKVTASSFVSAYFTASDSAQILKDLQGNNVVDANGNLTPDFGPQTDLSFLFSGAPTADQDRFTFEVRKTLYKLKGDPTLFAALPVPTSRLIAVKNQPGSFLLDTGDETYMLTPQGPSYPMLSAATSAYPTPSSPAVYDSFFIPIDATHYNVIYKDLAGNNIVNDVTGTSGWLTPYFDARTDLSMLFSGEPDSDRREAMINQVRRILLNLPSLTVLSYSGNAYPHIVTPTSFVTNDINATMSQQVFNDLKGNNVIDANGVVLDYDPTNDLSFLFFGAPPDQKAKLIPEVRAVLLALPKFLNQNSFVSADITAAASQAAFTALAGHGIIDQAGVVSQRFMPQTDLSFLFPTVADPTKTVQINEVRAVLLRYFNSTYLINANALTFGVERMSARASSRELSSRMFVGGVPELLALDSQNAPVVPQVPFGRLQPQSAVDAPAQYDGAQIDFDGPYGLYYWELFFHAPMLVSQGLALNQQYAAAKAWLEYILNPTVQEDFVQPSSFVTADINATHAQAAYTALVGLKYLGEVTAGNARVTPAYTPASSLDTLFADVTDQTQRAQMIIEARNVLGNFQLAKPASHVWQFRPFRNHTIETLKDTLTDPAQIATYNEDPFDPHAIARLRVGAYEKSIVMKYVDNLLNWGDMLFTQYTWESITNATLHYLYAYDILGDKPVDLGPCAATAPLTFADIQSHYAEGQIPQFFIDLENWLPVQGTTVPAVQSSGDAFNALDAYFCVPENAMLGGYWDRVEDRLYKIRNGLNIDGVAVPLALFDPPIDPMALVKLAASGAGTMGAAVAAQQKIGSQYRFAPLFDQANQLTAAVMQLGSSLLGALERNDSEALDMLRQTQEIAVLDLTTQIKQKQIDQLQATLDSLNKSQAKAQGEIDYYTGLKNDGLSSQEVASKICVAEAILFQSLAVPVRGIAIAGYLAPSIFGLADGGMQWGDAIAAGAEISGGTSQALQVTSQLTSMTAEFGRRSDEWQHQIDLATQDVAILQAQIDSTTAEIAQAKQELVVHKKTIANSNAVAKALRTKFTSAELYQWMTGRLASVYFQAYRMAVDAAKAAELAYQYETNASDTYINLSYWDSLHKGLLAGEALNFSLQQLRQAYIVGNVRKLEITRTISLLQLDAQQILNLRQGKAAEFSLTETMFDFDFPGHYARQIASIALSIPIVAGPYQNINATLTQTGNRVVMKPDSTAVDYLITTEAGGTPSSTPDASTLRKDWLAAQSIAISRGMNDTGMFELEFSNDRYMPFEGTGAVSDWTLTIPPENNRINLDQLTDVIIELKYTALSGVDPAAVKKSLTANKAKCAGKLYLNLKQMFAAAWKTFLSPQGSAPATQAVNFPLTAAMFPYFKTMTADTAAVRITTGPNIAVTGKSFVTLAIGQNSYPLIFDATGMATATLGLAATAFLGSWSLQVTLANAPDGLKQNGALNPQTLLNFELIVGYSADVLGS